MKMKIEMIILGVVLMVMVTGCQKVDNVVQTPVETPVETLVESPVAEIPETKETKKIFKGIDEDFTLEATNLWLEDVSLHTDSSLSLVNKSYNSYYIVLKDEKESLPKTIELAYYAELAGEATLRDLKDGVVTAMEDVEFNGIKGKRFYLKGMIEEVSITYEFLVFQNDTHFFQEIIWSSSENIEKNLSYYDDILLSFKYTE
ncbi:MAG: hypothetical protein WBI17_01510 [Clostridiaceae bacterium]